MVFAGALPIPETAKTILTQIADQCAACPDDGLSPAGNADIGFGEKFFVNFFAGDPVRGILVSYIMAGEDYVSVLRKNDLKRAKEILRKAFRNTKLFVIERKQYLVHSVLQPKSVEVNVTDQLHNCLHGSTWPLCCCCTDCSEECCEKRLGSTAVTICWDDPLQESRTITYTWYPHPGSSKIYTVTAEGNRTEMRWCFDSAGPGFLK